jgi:cobalt-zinc-cadmium efflux system outer membrane protein
MEAARIGMELVEAELSERRRQIVFEIQTHYAEAAAARERVTITHRILEVNQENYRLTSARVEKGDAAPLERQLLSVELKRMEAQRGSFEGKLAGSVLELKRIAGLGADESVATEAPFHTSGATAALDELKRRALAGRADLKAVEVAARQAGAEAELALANARPDLTLSARYSRRDSKFDQLGISSSSGELVPLRDQDNLLMLGISVPVFTKNRTKGEVEAARAREAAARLRADFLRKTIGNEVEAAYRRWEGARGASETLRMGVLDQSAENLSIIQRAYQLGQLRLLDVLNEQRRLLDSQLAYVDAVAEQAQAFAELQRAVGGDVR